MIVWRLSSLIFSLKVLRLGTKNLSKLLIDAYLLIEKAIYLFIQLTSRAAFANVRRVFAVAAALNMIYIVELRFSLITVHRVEKIANTLISISFNYAPEYSL